jgi:F-box associated protein
MPIDPESDAALGACTGPDHGGEEVSSPKFGILPPELQRRSHPSPTMSSPPPPLFSLSNELLIEIFSNLPPYDIYACQHTCRQLNELIVNSQLLQYISRTALSGVFDPLDPGLSLPDRLEALKRWETAWIELDLRKPDASIDAPVPAKRGGPPIEFSFGRYFVVIREGYGISAGYSFLDMHARSSSHTNAARWTTIEINTPNVLVFAFASELNLAVSISCVRLPVPCSHLPLPPSHPCSIIVT